MRCCWWDWRAGAPAPHFGMTSGFDFFYGVGLGDVEFGDGGAAEGCEMGSAAKALAHFVGDGAHVGSGGDAGAEVGAVVLDGGDGKFFYFDLNRLQHDFFLFAGEFVGGVPWIFFAENGGGVCWIGPWNSAARACRVSRVRSGLRPDGQPGAAVPT